MGALEHLTIEVPADMAARLRGRVAEGEFADISQAMVEAWQEFEAEQASSGNASAQDWLRRKIRSALATYEADPSCVLSVEQVREDLAAARTKRAVAQR